MATNAIITAKRLREILKYIPETGDFLWIDRCESEFRPAKKRSAKNVCSVWNSRYAGTVAGSKNSDGYILININGTKMKAHRLAWLYMEGEFPASCVDHANMNRADNRWSNLRLASGSENKANGKIYDNNKSGYKGVFWCKRTKKWAGQITIRGKRKHLGYYESAELASIQYAKHAEAGYKEFHRLK